MSMSGEIDRSNDPDLLQMLPHGERPISEGELQLAWELYCSGEMSLEEYTDIGLRFTRVHDVQ